MSLYFDIRQHASAGVCPGNIINGNDAIVDHYFRYLTNNLLSLKDSDGRLLWDLKIPVGVHWVPHVTGGNSR